MMEDDLRESLEVSLTHQIPREPFDKHIDETVYLEIQERLRAREQLPGYSSRPQRLWSKDVRLYTLLRMLGYCDGDHVFNKFEHEKIGDFWLPLTFSLLKQLSSGLDINPKIFMQKQLHVMSDSKQMDESSLLVPYFERRHKPGELGRGQTAQVVRVQHKLSGYEFAGKRFPRQRNVKGQQKQLVYFEQEVKVLQSVRHHHLVGLVASFTDLDSFLLVLDPIADTVLLDMLKQESPLSEVEITILDRSFNCLATALAFLHAHSLRHRDIKPGNILVSQGRVLICDFGISLEWMSSHNGTTEDSHPTFTRRYAAPEVFRLDASRNSKTDIWSLGCVFLEIFGAIKGIPFDDIAMTKRTDGQGFSSASMESWVSSSRAEQVDATYDIAINWALAMIKDDPHQRPAAGDLVNRIHEDTSRHGLTARFLASCCQGSGYTSSSELSIASTPINVSSSELHTNPKFGPRPRNVLLPQSYQQQTPVERGENSRITTSKPSVGSRSAQLPTSGVRQDQSDTLSVPRSAMFSSAETTTVTPGTSLRPDSVQYVRSDNAGVLSRTDQALSNNTSLQPDSVYPFFSDPEALSLADQKSPDPTMLDVNQTAGKTLSFSHLCNMQDSEELLFQNTFVNFAIEDAVAIKKFTQCCDQLVSTIKVYQGPVPKSSYLESDFWQVTRRVVLSNASSSTTSRCYSFWLPLANINYSFNAPNASTVSMQWSDCRWIHPGSPTDSREHRPYKYDPLHPNNDVTIEFSNIETARVFLDIIRFPSGNGTTVFMSNLQEIHTWDGREFGTQKTIVSLTTHKERKARNLREYPPLPRDQQTQRFSYSELFIVGHQVDRSPIDSDWNIELTAVKPTYIRDREKRLRTTLIDTWLKVSAAPDSNVHSIVPPPSIATTVKKLTGWKLECFTRVDQIDHKTFLGWESFGAADVLIWSKLDTAQPEVRMTYRCENMKGLAKRWFCGRVGSRGSIYRYSDVNYPSYMSSDTFEVYDMTYGRGLHIRNLTASPYNNKLTPSDAKPLRLRIRNKGNLRKFVELIDNLTLTEEVEPVDYEYSSGRRL